MPLVGIGISSVRQSSGSTPPSGGGGYTSVMNDYLTWLASEGGTLTDNEKTWLNTLTLNADIGEFDRLWIHGLSNQIAARISLVNALTASLLTEVNSPTWTAYEGYQGNGTTQYIDTNYNPSVDAVKYTLNSASFGIYITNALLDGSITPIGARSIDGINTALIYPNLGGNQYSYINFLTPDALSGITNAAGFLRVKRTSSTNIEHYKNASSLGTFSRSSTGIPVSNFALLAYLNGAGAAASFSQAKITVSFMGSGAIDQAQFYTDIQTLGGQLGWAI